jgi:hypothetical protein
MTRKLMLVGILVAGGVVAYGCSSSTSGNSGSGGGSEAGADVKVADVGQGTDTGEPDDASVDAPLVCPTPASVAYWKPPSYVPARQQPGACADADFSAYDAACINAGTSSTSSCSAFKAAHTSCVACLESNLTDSSWGPLVTGNGITSANVAGCIELTDSATTAATTCETALEALLQCHHFACDPQCPVTDAASEAQWRACVKAANGCGSQPFCLKQLDASAVTPCLQNVGNDEAEFLSIAPFFCGGGADAGAGADGASDAPPG